ncbi:hypothetical protein [Lacticaseibacillus sharpeae]|nr:hypothetical protein [Lacticaseibacillus sharpeae]
MTRREWQSMTQHELLTVVDSYIKELDMAAKPSMTAANRRSTDEIPLKQLIAYMYRKHNMQWSTILLTLGYPAQVRTRRLTRTPEAKAN